MSDMNLVDALDEVRRACRGNPICDTVLEDRSEFPQLIVNVPDDLESLLIAPLYDVHIGHRLHDAERFRRHRDWIARTPNVLTFNGGDLIENSSKLSVGGGVYEQDLTPQQQIVRALLEVAPIQNKMLFSLPGNHEDRTGMMGISLGEFISASLRIPYFPDFVFCTLRWRGNNFRILAHHGSGGAQSAGGQRNAARKALSWAKPVDLYWTGHLHNPLADILYQTDFDQETGEAFERNGFCIISPSYLRYFGGYAAKKQLPPGPRGLSVVELHEDGRMDISVHANGRRL